MITSSLGPARSTPRTQVAASAMSVVRTEISRVATGPSGGGPARPAVATAFSATSRMSAQARTGCRLCAASLLTGSFTSREKTQLKKLVAEGLAHVVVGTHAILEKDVEFKGEPHEERWGVIVTMVLPGGVETLLYEPRHPTAI